MMLLQLSIAAALLPLAQGMPLPGPASASASIQREPASDCTLSAVEKQRLLALTPSQFDQGMSGWRQHADRGCYNDAAMLIEAYATSVTDLKWRAILQFHNFQMLAFAGDIDRAVASLDVVERLDRERNADHGWSLYVAGTRAFMKRNKPGLVAQSDALAAFADQHGPSARVARLNGTVLLGLIRCFDQPYRAAYGGACARNGTTRNDVAPVKE